MSSSFYIVFIVLGLHATVHCFPGTQHEGKGNEVKHSIPRNSTLYKMSTNNADFAFNLYRKLASENTGRNVFFSPVSVSSALAMISLGAQSDTQIQILQCLGFNLTEMQEDEIHHGFHHLIHTLNLPNKELELKAGNALFIQKQVKILNQFTSGIQKLYESEAFSTDFSNVSEAEQKINNYVKKKTKGKIVEVIKDLVPNTYMILVNFIFFKAKWEKPFDPLETKQNGNFYMRESVVIKVSFMHQVEEHFYFMDRILNCTVLQMDYSKNALAIFVLPDEGQMKLLEDTLMSTTLRRWNHLLQKGLVNLYIPKFFISASYNLDTILPGMGIQDAFTNQADFSGISEHFKLKISNVVHKAVLDVGEKGTEAVAITDLRMEFRSALAHPGALIVFNRPFLVMILDKVTRSILFLGKVMEPKEQ
ncbi:thyroxine-binding globulin-like [Sarcophilus harrisii]|uniref:Thyroxine-binding globulin n=1 Tax=Sarcophilus harrisii TaxID=9305 RepID=G3VU07_SARHA|nr:thyroxine-binding globulin-like [Sarcophilus harrisii]XP_023360447.1 thyroxine-binding globulin-like [Sarcophilus harrisii]XP_023360452.1 thyroxine-binding globulin-like [Sarcophilus harrisii]